MYGVRLKKLAVSKGKNAMCEKKRKKKNWLVIYKTDWCGHDVVLGPMTKKKAKRIFEKCPNVRYAVHIKKERKFDV